MKEYMKKEDRPWEIFKHIEAKNKSDRKLGLLVVVLFALFSLLSYTYFQLA